MATRNSKKSKKATTRKAKPSKVAATKKPVKKALVKARPASKSAASAKSKSAPKAVKGKAKAKTVAKGKPKAKGSAIAKTGKAKAPVKKMIKAKPAASVKAGKAPKGGVKAKSSKPAVKAKSVKVKTVTKGKGIIKPAAIVKPKLKPVVGTKATDLTKKPSVSTSGIGKSMPVFKAKPTPPPSRPPVAPKMKPFEKMSDKKDFRPSVSTVAAEEPHKTRYSDKELEEFDQLIDQKLIVAREQLEFYLKQLEDMAENPDNKIKSLDDGLSTLESERVSSLASRQQKLIQHLENAKIRIKNKVYGICRETGKLISKERLRAVPHATLSIEAKQAQY